VELLVNILSKTPFYCVVVTKSIPPNLGGDPLKPLKGITMSYVQPIVPYSRPFRRPLNYPKYKKDYDPDVHVWVFKVAIKANVNNI
jgi:hypothetical protein